MLEGNCKTEIIDVAERDHQVPDLFFSTTDYEDDNYFTALQLMYRTGNFTSASICRQVKEFPLTYCMLHNNISHYCFH